MTNHCGSLNEEEDGEKGTVLTCVLLKRTQGKPVISRREKERERHLATSLANDAALLRQWLSPPRAEKVPHASVTKNTQGKNMKKAQEQSYHHCTTIIPPAPVYIRRKKES